MEREFTAVYKKAGKWVVAWVEELPGANTQGRTMSEARENLKEAIQLILEENRCYDSKTPVYRREQIAVRV